MAQRTTWALLAAAFVLVMFPGSARAAGRLPFSVGIGDFIPTSPSSSVEGFATFPGTTVRQTGRLSVEFSLGPELHPGNYQITAMLLSQKQSVSTTFPVLGSGPNPGNETITQVPIVLEDASNQFGAFRLGGGLGYDFVSYPGTNGARAGSGIVGDTFVQIGVSSGVALEAKYFFGQQPALGGVFAGITARL
jgi:hypothetical protein